MTNYRWTSEERAYLRELIKSPMSWRRRAEEMNRKFPERWRGSCAVQTMSQILLREEKTLKLIEALTGMLEISNTDANICRCGENMDRHGSDHVAVDLGSYNAGLLIREARDFLASRL